MKQPVAKDPDEHQHARRFGGIQGVYGEAGLSLISTSHVCVVGVGGVGSWVVESLARSALGAITLIDMDVVSVSNINRQLHATSDTLGRDKVAVMRDRVLQINPLCNVTIVDDFIAIDNLATYIHDSFDFVIDCIDDYRTKAALISYCRQQGICIISVGGAGGQVDATRIRQADLGRAQQDVLLAKTRKLLRQEYGFERNPKRNMKVPCVYSDEQLVYPDGQGGLSPQRPSSQDRASGSDNGLNCAGGIGSISHVTATFGLFASGYVLNQLAHAK